MLTNKLMGKTGEEKTYIEDVFSTYLYTGNGSTQTITNGIDLAGKGGMVWIKPRTTTDSHRVIDTLGAGVGRNLVTNSTAANGGSIGDLGDMFTTSPGFSLPTSGFINENGVAHASWTFRKAPKFFDVVTYTGTGTEQAISHNLGSTPGMIIIKSTSTAQDWPVYHDALADNYLLYLNASGAQDSSFIRFGAPTDTTFTVKTAADVNASGATYVAYLFAHDTTADGLIQCGSATTDASGNATVNLGWEPQYLMRKSSSGTDNWVVLDNMRNFCVDSQSWLYAGLSDAEASSTTNYLQPTATGFNLKNSGNSVTYIYMAIRRGPMRTPTDGTKVFNTVARAGTGAATTMNTSLNAPDVVISKGRNNAGGNAATILCSRLTDNYYLDSTGTSAQASTTTVFPAQCWDSQTSIDIGSNVFVNTSGYNYINYAFKRAPGFFDVVCYTGTGVARTVNHNLGVAPELMIVKKRSGGDFWYVGSSKLDSTWNNGIYLNTSAGMADSWYGIFNNAVPSSSTFSLSNFSGVNQASATYVAYLFASCPGVSKVGTFTSNNADQLIDCGFTNGARFVMIKATSTTGDWMVFDTARGIVAGNDAMIKLNATDAESSADYVDPYASGFGVTSALGNGIDYIYLAIA